MKTFTDERLEQMEDKLNGVIGRLLATMQGSDKEVKEAHALLLDFASDFSDLINEELSQRLTP